MQIKIQNYYRFIYSFLIVILIFNIFILINIINLTIPNNIFNSPDEMSNYLTMKEYAINNKMYFIDKYSKYDEGNNLHPRGFITYNDKIVPFNFLGTPIFYGVYYNIFYDKIRYISTILILIIILSLIKIFLNFYKENFEQTFFYMLIISCINVYLVYYFNFIYYNLIFNVTFIILFFYFIICWNKNAKRIFLYLGCLAAIGAIWFRYEIILFIFLFLFINFLYNRDFYVKNIKIKDIFILFYIIMFFLIVPLIILNKELYGKSNIYGYSLFQKIYDVKEKINNFNNFFLIFFPHKEFNLERLYNNIKILLFLVYPSYFFITYYSMLKKVFKRTILYLLIVIYFIIYSGMSPTYGSGTLEISIHKAVGRYWFILIILTILLVVKFFLEKIIINLRIKYLIISLMLISTVIIINNEFNKIFLATNRIQKVIINLEEIVLPKSYIITPILDKYIAQRYKIISWWGGVTDPNKYFEPSKLSNIIKILIQNNEDVYALIADNVFKYDPHIKQLMQFGLSFILVKKDNNFELYKVQLNVE